MARLKARLERSGIPMSTQRSPSNSFTLGYLLDQLSLPTASMLAAGVACLFIADQLPRATATRQRVTIQFALLALLTYASCFQDLAGFSVTLGAVLTLSVL